MEVKIIPNTEFSGCHKCKMLKEMCPDTPYIDSLDPKALLEFARGVGICTLPFLVVTGEPDELAKIVEAAK